MNAARWERLMYLFDKAHDLDDLSRAAFLDAECSSDGEMRREVESLLAADADASGFLEPASASAVRAAVIARSVALEENGVAAALADDAPLLPRIQTALGDGYTVERELGGGGMSRIFLAVDRRLARQIVVKVLPPELSAALDVERFRREIRVAAGLRHPHIVPLLAADESAGSLFYYTMPFIEGESLRHRLDRDGFLTDDEVARTIREIADALSYAHRRGVVHRDVKPANILVDGSHVLVSDFGIAKAISAATEVAPTAYLPVSPHSDEGVAAANGETALTGRGLILGTPSYMSPEQARGDDVDVRSDIYSLGCLAFEMLTGNRPRTTTPDAESLENDIVDKKRRALSPRADAVIARAMAARPEDRFVTPDEFASALAAALSRESGEPATIGRATWNHPARRTALAAAATGIVLMIAFAVGNSARFSRIPRADSLPTLAILPFTNIGPSQDQYFADGVAEEIGVRLSRIAGLKVIAWTSTSGARGGSSSPADVGHSVGAAYVLDGSVRWVSTGVSGAVRITPKLVRVSDGAVVWTDSYDSDAQNLPGVQGAVAERVASSLNVRLVGRERVAALSQGTTNPAAYDEYLRGNAVVGRRYHYDRDARRAAVKHYQRAVELDPRFASAWAKLARASRESYRFGDDSTALTRAQFAALRAIALDSTLADANLAMGELDTRPWRAVERYLFAIRLNPNNAELQWAVGNAQLALGLRDDALASFERAVSLDPRNPDWYAALADVHDIRNEFKDAIRVRARQIALDSTNTVTFLAQALSYFNQGDTASARRTLARSIAANGRPRLVQIFALRAGLRSLRVLGAELDNETRHAIDTLSQSGSDSHVWVIHRLKAEELEREGRFAESRAQLDSARSAITSAMRRDHGDPNLHEEMGFAFAGLGMRDSAVSEGRLAIALDTVPAQAAGRAWRRFAFAMIAVRAGDNDAAIDALSGGLPNATPVVTAYWLRLDPVWKPLRNDPRFTRILAASR